jgi:Ca2+-binding RTX toxin-like protein
MTISLVERAMIRSSVMKAKTACAAGNDRFDGGLDSDRINEVVDSNVVILAGGLNSPLLGSDTFVNLERVNLSGGSGNNLFDARQATVSVLLVGGDGNDTLLGGFRNDVLQGGTGDDVLSGGPGVDAVDGGDGVDFLYEKANANFTVIGTQVSSSVTGTETPLNIERIALIGGDGNNVLNAAQAGVRVVLIGGRGNDTLIGSSQADTLSGGNRNDSIVAGSDGVDSLDGGLSSDLLEQDSPDQRVADNSDTVVANVFATLPNWIDAL